MTWLIFVCEIFFVCFLTLASFSHSFYFQSSFQNGTEKPWSISIDPKFCTSKDKLKYCFVSKYEEFELKHYNGTLSENEYFLKQLSSNWKGENLILGGDHEFVYGKNDQLTILADDDLKVEAVELNPMYERYAKYSQHIVLHGQFKQNEKSNLIAIYNKPNETYTKIYKLHSINGKHDAKIRFFVRSNKFLDGKIKSVVIDSKPYSFGVVPQRVNFKVPNEIKIITEEKKNGYFILPEGIYKTSAPRYELNNVFTPIEVKPGNFTLVNFEDGKNTEKKIKFRFCENVAVELPSLPFGFLQSIFKSFLINY